MPSIRSRREHVVSAVRNSLAKLRIEIGDTVIRSMDKDLERRCFTLGWLDSPLQKLPQKVSDGLRSLINVFKTAIEPVAPIPVTPIYDPARLILAVQAATRDFHGRWYGRLGLVASEGERREHWTRIKALNRRIADGTDSEYDSLRPVADLYTRMTEEISMFLEKTHRLGRC